MAQRMEPQIVHDPPEAIHHQLNIWLSFLVLQVPGANDGKLYLLGSTGCLRRRPTRVLDALRCKEEPL